MASRYNGHKDKDDYDDYDYSDSFVSDEDDESVKKQSPQTRKVAQVTARKKPPTHRGHKGRISSRATAQSQEPKVDNAVQRMLSSKNLRINELKNQLQDFRLNLDEMKEENKLLKKTQKRQEKALGKFENEESDLPQLLQRHNNEVRTLREQLKKTQDKYQRTDRYLRDAEDELDKTKNKLKKYKNLAEDKNLLERQELQKKVQQTEIDLEEKDVKVRGCFAYKGKKKRVNPADYFKACEHPVFGASRQSTCDQTWEEIDQEIQILRADLNSKIFDDLLAFTSSCHEKFSLDYDHDHKDSFVTEIPTAALVTGVNTPDHGVMFSTLVELLHERVSPLVAILRSKDCNKVKNVLTKTLGQLLQNPDMFTDEDDDLITNTKNLPCTLSTLSAWYNNKYKQPHSPSKKRKSVSTGEHQRYPPIVIVFEDLESWVPQILQDFITICSNYIHHLPIVFVFGIATSVAAVHRLLPNTVSSLLCMEKFQAPPSTEYLTLVINQIIMTSKFPFKLGSKVFQLLLDIFLYHDFSVLNFIKGLQFCILDHFFSFPCSRILCHHEDLPQTIKGMKHHDIESVRMTPSFMRYVESSPPKEQIDLLENDDYTKNVIEEFVSQINKYHELFFPVLRCLHCLVSKLPKHPLGKQLREVYSMTLGSFVCETEQYKDAIELLKMMSKDELTELMKTSVQELEQDIHNDLQDIPPDLERLLQRFDTLHEIPEEEEDTDSQEESALHLEKTDLHNLRKKLMEAGKKSKKLSPYEKLRLEVVDYYDNLFRKYLSCPKSFPLHEVFYYDSAADVKRQLNSSPRSAVQTALATPHHYLQCKCCEMEPGIISSMMPDLCIVYKLHLECTQLINLFDWLQAFVTVVTSEQEEEEGKKKTVEKVLQARFIRAVSELQFLGFIKPTKRKTDHVARLTWGGC